MQFLYLHMLVCMDFVQHVDKEHKDKIYSSKNVWSLCVVKVIIRRCEILLGLIGKMDTSGKSTYIVKVIRHGMHYDQAKN